MISRLFRGRKRLDSSDPQDRLAALQALSDEDARAAQSHLAEMATNDADEAVRTGALRRLTDPDILKPLLADSTHAFEVAERVAGLVAEGKALDLAEHPVVIRARLAARPSGELIDSILARGDETQLLEAVLVCPREQKDQLLEHVAFQRATVLTELERRSRDRDKRTNRFARSRLEEIRQHRAAAERLVGKITERLETLEKPTLDQSNQEALRRSALLESMSADMNQLDRSAAALVRAGEPLDVLPELARRGSVLRAAADTRAKQEIAQRAADAAPPAQPQSDAPAAAGAAPEQTATEEDFEQLTGSFEALDQALLQNGDFASLAAERQQLTQRWLAGADRSPPDASQHAVFDRVSRRFQQLAGAHERLAKLTLPEFDLSLLPTDLAVKAPPEAAVWQAAERLRRDLGSAERALGKLDWPDWAPATGMLSQHRQILESVRQRLAEWQAQVDGIDTSARAALTRLNGYLDDGELKNARREAGDVRALLRVLPDKLAQPLDRQLAKASGRLSELSDWQTFATSPKRESLCAALTALVETPLAPKDQAHRIKQLRTEWNELGPVTGAADHKLLKQFNDAAEKAFEPCRTYFAEQADERGRNLAARVEICESLAGYLSTTDWTGRERTVDYKAAERIMRTARDEWRRFHPVDRIPGKPVEERFEALQTELHTNIKAEWDRNLASKRQIVEQAQALVDGEQDVQDRIEAAKSLQQRWKAVGVTPRRPDQQLWRDFRKACDAVFAARDIARKSADESIRNQQQEAQALLEAFSAALDDEARVVDAALVRDYQKQFDALPRLPERLQRPLDREFSELGRAAQLILLEARSAAERQRLQNLKAQDIEVSTQEQHHRNGETVAFESPDPFFDERWTLVDQPVPREALQRLVIEAEIAAEVESIDADRALRMSIQVELMNSGRGREALDATPIELIDRWCRIGPKDAGIDPLRERFFSAVEKLAAR